MRSHAYALAAVLAVATAAGCSEYHYYDIDVSFNITPPMNFSGSSDVSLVQNCVVTVSGADNDEFTFGDTQNCPPFSMGGSPLSHMGIFEFASTADSGQLTFTFRAYVGPAIQECQVGEGAKTVNIGATTVADTLLVNRINAITACQ